VVEGLLELLQLLGSDGSGLSFSFNLRLEERDFLGIVLLELFVFKGEIIVSVVAVFVVINVGSVALVLSLLDNWELICKSMEFVLICLAV